MSDLSKTNVTETDVTETATADLPETPVQTVVSDLTSATDIPENLNFNETEPACGLKEETFMTADTSDGSGEGSFNEVETENDNGKGNFNEVEAVGDNDEGNFNEVETVGDNGEGNFNEIGSNGKLLIDRPSETPAPKSPKALVGVVIALAAVILGLIIFLIVSIINSKNNSKTADNTKNNTTVTASTTPLPANDNKNMTPSGTGTEDNGQEENNGSQTDGDVTGTPDEDLPINEIPKFDVTCEVGQYKGLSVDYSVAEVTDEEIQAELDYFINMNYEEKLIEDRPLKNDDEVLMDYVGTIDGEEFEKGSATDAWILLGSGTFIPGFEEGLIGKNVGDTVSLDLTFPETYKDEAVAGKPVNFKVTIKEAYEYVLPELTDELVSENSEYSTVEEYKEGIRKELEEQHKQSADSKFKEDLIVKIIESSKFSGQIEEQIAHEEQETIDYYDNMCSMYGVDGATYFSYVMHITADEYYAIVRKQAEMSVKYSYCLDEIAKLEGLTASEEEYEQMFQDIFIDTYGFVDKDEVYEQMPESEAREIITGYVLHDKAEKIIRDSAIINNK